MSKLQKIWIILTNKEGKLTDIEDYHKKYCQRIDVPDEVLNANFPGEIKLESGIYFQEYPFFAKVERGGHVFVLQNKDPYKHYITIEGGDIIRLMEFMDKYKNP